ncbi:MULTISPECIES: DUF2103 domain-containing protein [Dehalobacter]|jgi:hypothetical protein|uniref:Uncharacterized protein n=2 Tax=Dehalobacter restrictus TaxID=55583 RepID=A0A857DI81_9FIRM|nr:MULTISPECIES: DUF2103 domain-containing protein [Dehalobacter]AHF09736.1 hypothetical protein DEHRE_06340 [Dehalobacter restrictus DSM 9455]MCG1025355.1 hypothetical protein [Dehalobacter sp.]MDJ0306356.1 DUF2103 domain-containing protein [Dehalobacter sp.]QHA00328.1 hypothetical protein GQ588_06615 [Dehalobacter restrictus]
MKFRRNKIKREHSIITGALDWLEDLSKRREITDIIPGVIDVTNTRERGATYQYETPTGCKILLKNGGSVQEAFIVTRSPEVVKEWAAKLMEEINYFQAALEETRDALPQKDHQKTETRAAKQKAPVRTKSANGSVRETSETFLSSRDALLAGIKEDYQLVEINRGLRDSYVESLASMGDLEDPKLEDALQPEIRQALEKLQEKLQGKGKIRQKQPKRR